MKQGYVLVKGKFGFWPDVYKEFYHTEAPRSLDDVVQDVIEEYIAAYATAKQIDGNHVRAEQYKTQLDLWSSLTHPIYKCFTQTSPQTIQNSRELLSQCVLNISIMATIQNKQCFYRQS